MVSISRNYTGVLVTKSDYDELWLLVFKRGQLEFDKVLESKSFFKCQKEVKEILKSEEIGYRNLYYDNELYFKNLVEEILEEERLVFDYSSYDDDYDDDDYDGSIASYFSDPNHWND